MPCQIFPESNVKRIRNETGSGSFTERNAIGASGAEACALTTERFSQRTSGQRCSGRRSRSPSCLAGNNLNNNNPPNNITTVSTRLFLLETLHSFNRTANKDESSCIDAPHPLQHPTVNKMTKSDDWPFSGATFINGRCSRN